MSDQPKNVGAFLKAEREKRGIPLAVVHETTKIPMDSLRAIEEGYKIRTLTSFYYKSFVKLYAQYLGLDVATVLDMIPLHHPLKKKIETEAIVAPKIQKTPTINIFVRPMGPKKTKKFAVIVGVLVACVVLGVMVFSVVKKIRQNAAASQAVDRAMMKPGVKHGKVKVESAKKIEKIEKLQKNDRVEKVERVEKIEKAEKSEKIEPVKAVSPPVVDLPKKQEPKPVQVAPVEQATVPVPSVKQAKKVSLVVRAQVNAWITVKADGAVVFQATLKKGTSELWSASKKIELSGKDIDQLDFEVNGKMIGKISRRDMKVRRIVVTSDGLSVEK